MTIDVQTIADLVRRQLINTSPIYSGNLNFSLNQKTKVIPTSYGAKLIIDAPEYDVNLYKKKKIIVHKGHRSYANELNEMGAFGTHNRSEHWTNRAVYDAVSAYALTINAQVINKLDLS